MSVFFFGPVARKGFPTTVVQKCERPTERLSKRGSWNYSFERGSCAQIPLRKPFERSARYYLFHPAIYQSLSSIPRSTWVVGFGRWMEMTSTNGRFDEKSKAPETSKDDLEDPLRASLRGEVSDTYSLFQVTTLTTLELLRKYDDPCQRRHGAGLRSQENPRHPKTS